jgi:tetratricopeptide (TPR) repeat protein
MGVSKVSLVTSSRSRRLLRVALGLAVLLIGGLASYFYLLGPRPPEVALGEAGPGVSEDIAEASQEVRYFPFWGPTWGNLGLVLHAYGYFAEAAICYARAERLDPWGPRWPYLQAVLLLRTDLTASVPLLERAVRLGGEVQTPRLELGEALVLLGRPKEAETHFQIVLDRHGDDARALLGMGRVAHARGNLSASRDFLERSVASDQRVKASRVLLAEVLHRLGRSSEAIAQRAAAASLPDKARWPDPYRTGQLQELRGEVQISYKAQDLVEQGEDQAALDLVHRALRKNPQSHLLYRSLGRTHFKLGELNAAEKAYREGVRLKPDNLTLQFERGLVLEKQGCLAEAATCFRAVIKLKAEDGPAHYHLGRCLYLGGDQAGALQAYRAAVRYQPQLVDAHLALGRMLALLDQNAEAIATFQQALELDPTNVLARNQLAEVQGRKKLMP